MRGEVGRSAQTKQALHVYAGEPVAVCVRQRLGGGADGSWRPSAPPHVAPALLWYELRVSLTPGVPRAIDDAQPSVPDAPTLDARRQRDLRVSTPSESRAPGESRHAAADAVLHERRSQHSAWCSPLHSSVVAA